MKYTVFDIETIGLPDELLPPFDESTVAVGNLKDPEKIKAKIDDARAEWRKTLALSPLTGQVAMVGFMDDTGQSTISSGDELSIVTVALERIIVALIDGQVVAGFNSFSFDLPFLLKRAWTMKLAIPTDLRVRIRGRTYWHENLVDLRDEWLMGDRAPAKGTSSLESVARFLGLPEKLGNGSEFAGMTPDERKAYLLRDLEITLALYRRIIP